MSDALHIVTWNVNSLRARLEHVTRWIGDHRPDILCLQETKVPDDQFPAQAFADLGYEVAYHGQKTYNGVAIAARHPIEAVTLGFNGDGEEEQKRFMAATVQGIRVLNAYIPNGQTVDSPKFVYKLEFMQDMVRYLEQRHDKDEPLVLVGDFNVAPEAADVFSVEEMDGQIGFHPDERAALERLRDWGFHDAFRLFECGDGFYSWWDYRQGSFRRNRGLRIDHIWLTEPLQRRANACWIDREERARTKASDHAPVVAEIYA